MEYLDELKLNLREADCPFFSDEELELYYQKNDGDIKATSYECLITKAQNTRLSISGLNCADTSKYFLRLAAQYRTHNSGILEGGW